MRNLTLMLLWKARDETAASRRALALSAALLAGLGMSTTSCTARSAETRLTDPLTAPFEVIEIRGAHPGPTVGLVAGIHGGKISASVALRQFVASLDPSQLHGTVLVVPVANVEGRRAGLAQTHPADGLNLNRVFPGRADGTITERIAARLMLDIVSRSDYLVDLHGADGEEAVGRFAYAARPGLDPRVDSLALRLAEQWGTPRVVWDQEGPRTLATSRFLQTAAHLSGVPAITVFETGAERESAAAIASFEAGLRRLLVQLGIVTGHSAPTQTIRHSRRSVITAAATGDWQPLLGPDQRVRQGERLGLLVRSSGVDTVVAPADGVVLHQRLAGAVTTQHSLVILADDTRPRDPDR